MKTKIKIMVQQNGQSYPAFELAVQKFMDSVESNSPVFPIITVGQGGILVASIVWTEQSEDFNK